MNKNILALWILAFASIFFLTGSTTYDYVTPYHDSIIRIKYTGSKTIAVAVHDKRPYVTSGEYDPEYVGTIRNALFIPCYASTETRKPLAEDMTNSICASFEEKGFNALPIYLTHEETLEQAQEKFKQTQCDRIVYIVLYEWYNEFARRKDCFLYYNVKLYVLDKDLNILTQTRLKGEATLYSNTWDRAVSQCKLVPRGFRKKFGVLLNRDKVRNALR